jgi:hypothetical protein
VLVDADNLDLGRLRLVAGVLARSVTESVTGSAAAPRLVVAGHPARVAAVDWPAGATVLEASGWQRADLALVASYVADAEPLVLVTGDGDFALLATRHPGPVLVVGPAGATSARLRNAVTVVDPVHDGLERLRTWLAPDPA